MSRRRPRKMRGGDLRSFLSSANNYLRKTKIISRVARTLGSAGVPYASQVSSVANQLGYGRRRRVGRPRLRRRRR